MTWHLGRVLRRHRRVINFVPSPDEVATAQSPNGRWSMKQLAERGVPWPLPTG